MSEQALRFTSSRAELHERAATKADRRLSSILREPVRSIRARREAFNKMFEMITRVQDAAAQPKKRGLVIGTGYYVAHNGEHFIVYKRGAGKVFEKSVLKVALMFDPLQFMSGHLSD